MTDPRDIAWKAIDEVIAVGLTKHVAEGWRDEPQDFHLDKGCRHLMTYKLIRNGHIPPD